MDNNRLRYFLVVSEIENIRKAADALHITPSALSKSIKQLEYEVGTPLLVPSGRGISITENGKQLAKRARPLLEEWEKLRYDLRERKSKNALETPPLRIGSFEVFSTYFLRCLMDSLSKSNELVLREIVPSQIEKSLLDYEIDYGITNLPIPTAGIVHQHIAFYDLKIYGRKDVFEAMPFSALPFAAPITPILDSPNEIKTLDGWPESELTRLVKYKVDMLESALELCRQGKAVAYLPSFVVNLHNDTVKPSYNLSALPFPPEVNIKKQAIYLATRKVDPPNQITKEITHALSSLKEKLQKFGP